MDARLSRFEFVLSAQQGLVTLTQLRDGGITNRQRQELVERRVIRRIRPGVFGLIGSGDSWERQLLAIVLAVDGCVASHSSAARLWGFDPRPADQYEITAGRQHRIHLVGVNLHTSKTIGSDDITERDGIACSSFERTVADCTTLLNEGQLGRVLDQGLRRGVASLQRLKDCAERAESGPGRHMSIVRSLLAARGIGFDPGGSRSELYLLDVLRRANLPLPVQQYVVKVGTKTYRPDFAWPKAKVFAEYYGLPFHTGVSAVIADSERLTALSAAGWLPLVFTHKSSDREIIERTRAALEQRGVACENTS